MRLPLTARAQLETALSLGHVPSIEQTPRGLWRFHCSCGYSSTTRQTRALATGTLAWHLGKIIGLAETNGLDPRQASAPDVAPERAQPPAGTDAARHGGGRAPSGVRPSKTVRDAHPA